MQTEMELAADPWASRQSRYVAYCRAYGATSPEEMLARDDEAHPGGKMTGFIVWISERWREWRGVTGYQSEQLLPIHHESFDAWLESSNQGGNHAGT